MLTGLEQLLQLKVAGLLFIWGVCVDWLGTVTSIKSSWIVVYLGGMCSLAWHSHFNKK